MNNNHGGEECYSLEYSNDASTVLPPPAKKQQHRRVKKDEEEDEEQLTLDRHIRQAAKDLETKGYAVIPAVLSKKECDEALAEMWQVWESATAEEALPLKPSGDYNRVSSDHLPPHTHGIIHTERLNHARVVRRVRCHPNVVRVFASLYGTQDLLSSMDRVNFKFPGRRYSSKEGSWAHVDQNPSKKGLWCVQAYVDILGTPNDKCPGNRLYEGSHLLFDTVLADSQEGKEADGDWVKLSKETKDVYLKDKGCKMAKPLCDPGSMILWDSRTVHDPDDELATEAQLKKEREALRATRHTPLPQHLFSAQARSYGKEIYLASMDIHHLYPMEYASKENMKAVEKALLPNERESYLFGFAPYSGPAWKKPALLKFVDGHGRVRTRTKNKTTATKG